MIETLFDVNNIKNRNEFLSNILPRAVNSLNEDKLPLWGKMTPQHMIEHLISTFELSVGKHKFPCKTPEELLPRVKAFLSNNTKMPHDYKNPLIGEEPLPLQYKNLQEAKEALLEELNNFRQHYITQPDAVYTHPIFGPLGKEEWERIHYKHCYHHLTQFNTIVPTNTGTDIPETASGE